MKANKNTAVPEMPSYSERMAEKLRFNFTENIQEFSPKLESFRGVACKLDLQSIVFSDNAFVEAGNEVELTTYDVTLEENSSVYIEIMPDGQVYNLCGKNISLELRDGVLVFGGAVKG